MQYKKLPPSSPRAASATAFVACKIATNKEPKQTDPKDVVRVRMTLPITPPEQQPECSGENHQLPTVPLLGGKGDVYVEEYE